MPSPGEHIGAGLGRRARAALDAAGYGTGAILAGMAGARGGKAVHPAGVAHRGRLVVHGGAGAPEGSDLLGHEGEWPALVRFSRSVGFPRPIPDLLGISLRIVDAYGTDRHQDLLMVTSVDLPILHHAFVPAADTQQRVYSSSLPYRAGGETFLVGALPDPSSPRPSGDDEFDRLDKAAATGRLVFGLGVAPVLGRFRRIASLHVEERLPPVFDALRFNPFNTGGGLAPTGFLNLLRDYAYPLSQSAWGRRDGRADAQRKADEELRRLFPAAPAPGPEPVPA